MSIQDDIFDLNASLKGDQKRQFQRIVTWALGMERELELVKPKVAIVNQLIGLVQEELRDRHGLKLQRKTK